MKYKIVALHASPRKKSTYKLLQETREIFASHNMDLEIIHIDSLNIKPCRGCQRCILDGKCVHKDDMETVEKTLNEANGVILATPVYIGHVSAQLKIFLDRTCSWYHRPPLVGIAACSLITTAYSGVRQTVSYLEKVAMDWGMIPGPAIVRNAGSVLRPVTRQELSVFIHNVEAPLKQTRPRLIQLISFSVQKVLALYILARDKQYWEMNGWDKKDFFYACRIGPVRKLLNKLFYWNLARNVKKTHALAREAGQAHTALEKGL